MNKKGFLLVDALANCIITSLLCLLCFVCYQAYDNYLNGYDEYLKESNEKYDDLNNSIGECEKCLMPEEDTETDLS